MDEVSILILGGMTLFALLLLQVASGLRWIKVSPQWHKRGAIVLLVFAAFHAVFAITFLT